MVYSRNLYTPQAYFYHTVQKCSGLDFVRKKCTQKRIPIPLCWKQLLAQLNSHSIALEVVFRNFNKIMQWWWFLFSIPNENLGKTSEFCIFLWVVPLIQVAKSETKSFWLLAQLCLCSSSGSFFMEYLIFIWSWSRWLKMKSTCTVFSLLNFVCELLLLCLTLLKILFYVKFLNHTFNSQMR